MLYSSIDTLSVVFDNISLSTIFEKLNFFPDNVKSLFEVDDNGQCKFIQNKGYKSVFKIPYNNIWFEGDLLNNDIEILNCNNYFDWKFSKIRVEFTGQGLEFLRRANFNPDTVFQDKAWFDSFATTYRITRCDFAFDFINEKEDNFYEIMDFVDLKDLDFDKRREKRKYLSTGRQSGITFQRRTGDMNLLYLGKRGSSKMLRVYDKLMERKDKVNSLDDIPYSFIGEEINSWWRVEIQLRREYAPMLLFASTNKNLDVQFYYVFENFMIYDKDEEGKFHVLRPMFELYEWARIQELYKMQNQANKENAMNIDKAENFVQSVGASSCIQIAGHSGPFYLVERLEQLLIDCQLSNEDYQVNRCKSLNLKISSDASQKNISFDEWFKYCPEDSRGIRRFDLYLLSDDFIRFVYTRDSSILDYVLQQINEIKNYGVY